VLANGQCQIRQRGFHGVFPYSVARFAETTLRPEMQLFHRGSPHEAIILQALAQITPARDEHNEL
jgi:hypothetical protein